MIPVLKRLKQEEHEFNTSLGYILRSCIQKKKTCYSNVVTGLIANREQYFGPRGRVVMGMGTAE